MIGLAIGNAADQCLLILFYFCKWEPKQNKGCNFLLIKTVEKRWRRTSKAIGERIARVG